MSVNTHEVFIASSFAEFSELRRRLVERIHAYPGIAMRAVCFDDNRPRSSAPLLHSLEAARRCDVMVLLVGREYGGQPPGEERSYANLEHAAALSAEPPPVVLPFLVELPAAEEEALGPALTAWRRAILEQHTAAFIPADGDPERVSAEICEAVSGALFEILTEAERQELATADLDDGLGNLEGPGLDAEELAFLERRSGAARTFGQEGDELKGRDELLRHPARVAAVEQRNEAFKALVLGERTAAIAHFRRALEHRQLDLESSYWLAHLLSTTGRRADSQEAVSLALRAAKIADDEGRTLRAAAAHVVAARAAARLGDHEQSLALARKATTIAPWFADAHRELACAHARRDEVDEALEAAGDAFFRHPTSFRRLRRDPAFQRHARALSGLENRLRARVKAAVTEILRVEAEIADEAAREPAAHRLLDLVSEGRRAAHAILERLAGEATALRQAYRDFAAEKGRLRELRETWIARKRKEGRELAAAQPAFPVWSTVGIGFVVVILLSMALSSADWSSGTSLGCGVFALLFAVAGLISFWSWQRKRRHWKKRVNEAQTTFDHAIAEIDMAEDRRPASYEEFRLHAGRLFEHHVVAFEESALRWAILSPSRGPQGAGAGDLVRLGGEAPAGWMVDDHPLHPELQPVLEIEPLTLPNQRLYRVVEIDDRPFAARWACYVPPQGPPRLAD